MKADGEAIDIPVSVWLGRPLPIRALICKGRAASPKPVGPRRQGRIEVLAETFHSLDVIIMHVVS